MHGPLRNHFGERADDSAAGTQAVILGGSLVNLAFNIRLKNPTAPHRPLIDYSAALVLEPMLLAGTTFGVMLNVILPTWLLVVLLVITLTFAAVRTARKVRLGAPSCAVRMLISRNAAILHHRQCCCAGPEGVAAGERATGATHFAAHRIVRGIRVSPP